MCSGGQDLESQPCPICEFTLILPFGPRLSGVLADQLTPSSCQKCNLSVQLYIGRFTSEHLPLKDRQFLLR